jgi:hypothetical protein
MVVRITVIAVSEDSPPIVAFEAPVGGGAGCWIAGRPVLGRGYDVEIEIDDELEWGQQVRLAVGDEVGLSTVDGDVRVRARYEAVDGGLATLSVGGSIVMIEVTGIPAGLQAGTVVELVIDRRAIRLFPYEL